MKRILALLALLLFAGPALADGFAPAAGVPRSGGTFTGGVTVPSLNGGALAGFRNVIINGDFRVAQRGTSFTSASTPANSDDTYLLDRWILLSDGNDIVDVTQSTTAPTNGLNSIALDVETVDKKFGIFQPIEQKNCLGLFGQTVTASFQARTAGGGKLDNVKAAIVTWSSTADTVTSDIVSAWGNEGTNPTLAANWTYENVPGNLNVTTSFVRYSITAAMDTSGGTNCGVFIWSDVTDTDLEDFLYITDVQLEVGSVATTFERRPYSVELDLCQFYAQWLGGTAVYQSFGAGHAITTDAMIIPVRFVRQMRTAPTISISDVTHFAVDNANGTPVVLATFAANHITSYGFTAEPTTAALGLTATNPVAFFANNTTAARLKFEAEM